MNQNTRDPKESAPLPLPGAQPTKPVAQAEEGAKPLTPEEQLALYEDHLKETDWGHQPC